MAKSKCARAKPTRTLDMLPEQCIATGDIEVWWYDQYNSSWVLGTAIFMDFNGNPNLYYQYTYWLPTEAISLPEFIVDYNEDLDD